MAVSNSVAAGVSVRRPRRRISIRRLAAGSGGIGKLHSFIVMTAVPVSLILLPSLWDGAAHCERAGETANGRAIDPDAPAGGLVPGICIVS